MEDALQPTEDVLEPLDQPLQYNKPFVIGIAASVVLHLICTVIVIGLPGGSRPSQSVTYVDLSLPHAPAPATPPPAKRSAPQLPPQLQEPVETQKPLPPAEPQQAQQAKAEPDQRVTAPEKKVQEQRSATTFGMGLTKGFFKTIGEGETLRPGVKEYYLDLVEQINQKWWLDQQFEGKQIGPIALTIKVGRNGEIVDIWISRGSGNTRYDNAVLAALRAAGPFPPLPTTLAMDQDFFIVPIRLVPPLNLLAW